MISNSLSPAADPLRDLVSTVALLHYSDPSFTVSMYADRWTVDVDAGESVDDIVRLDGPDLNELLSKSVLAVRARSRQLPTPAPREEHDDLEPLMELLANTRARLSSFPLDFSFIPRTAVSPGRPWEVTVVRDGQTVVSAGATPLEALSRAVK